MKTTLLFLFILLISSLFGQDSVIRDSLYKENDILSQFILEHEGIDSKNALGKVKNWASSAFANAKEVTVAEGDNFIVFKPILTFTFDSGMGTRSERKITAHTKFEFKNGRTRVTITELPSTYTSSTGVYSYIIWPQTYGDKEWPREYKNKGMNKVFYRQFTRAIETKDKWVNNIKSIDFNKNVNSEDDW